MQTQHPTLAMDLMTERRARLLEDMEHRQIVDAVCQNSETGCFSISAAIGHLLVAVGNWLERGSRRTPIITPEATASLAR
jgi:hypothetical protein